MSEAKPAKPPRQPGIVIKTRPAGENHAVITVVGGGGFFRKEPCDTCPWRKDTVGVFPAEAFRHSASTGYTTDAQARMLLEGGKPSTFGCHQSKSKAPATCAGFLLSDCARQSLALRLSKQPPNLDIVTNGGNEMFADYFAMAVANGVAPNDPVLADCFRMGGVRDTHAGPRKNPRKSRKPTNPHQGDSE